MKCLRQRSLVLLIGLIVLPVLALLFATVGTPSPARAQSGAAPLIILMEGDLWSYSEATGTLTQLTRWGYNQPPVISPDGRRVAYASVSEIAIDALRRFGETPNVPPSNIWLWDIPTGQSLRIATQPPNATFGTGLAGETFVRRSTPTWSPDGTMLAWVEETVTAGASAFQIVIYDVALNGFRASGSVSVAGMIFAAAPKWGKTGIVVRVQVAESAGTVSERYQVFDSIAALKNEVRPPANLSTAYDYYWINQQGQEYLGIYYNNGNWVLLNPINGTQFALPGLPEMVNPAAPDSVGVYFVPNNATGGLAWGSYWGNQQIPLSFTGFPDQIAIAPSGQALAFAAGDGVYLVRSGSGIMRVPGTERILGRKPAFVAWSAPEWRIHSRQILPPTLTPLPPVVNQPCINVPPPRLTIGTLGRVTAFPSQSNALNSLPGRPGRTPGSVRLALIPVGGVFTVLNGPVCGDGLLWWQVNYSNVVGWTAEGEGNTYWLEPYSGPQGSVCPPNLPPRLTIGGQGRVTPGVPNALRSQPSRNSAISAVVGSIPGGGVFTVLNGPVCADGYAWWQVSYQGMTGWTPEGEGITYWLEPLLCGFQVPSRLVVGGRGRVTPGLPNAVRSQPSRNREVSAVLGEIPAGGVFSVIAGPQCGDGFVWWLVNYQGLVGWTPEGQGTTYWLEPVR